MLFNLESRSGGVWYSRVCCLAWVLTNYHVQAAEWGCTPSFLLNDMISMVSFHGINGHMLLVFTVCGTITRLNTQASNRTELQLPRYLCSWTGLCGGAWTKHWSFLANNQWIDAVYIVRLTSHLRFCPIFSCT
jgi:hypothetical protein